MISNTHLQHYNHNGYAHCHSALNKGTVREWRHAIIDATHNRTNVSQGHEYIAVFEPDRAEKELRSVLCSNHLASIAAQFLDTSMVRLFAAAAYLKPPGGSPSFWHQDLWFFPIADAPLITLWLPLSSIEKHQAPLVYARGSHTKGFINWVEESAPTQWPLDSIAPIGLGDVVVHDGWLLHGSEANSSEHSREALGLVYIREGTRFATRERLQLDRNHWLKMEHYLNDPFYVEGATISGQRCPLITID